ncbi:MAG: circularly permuted type 2 ATP-grasp protein [Solirubrobacteraceae bacterium]
MRGTTVHVNRATVPDRLASYEPAGFWDEAFSGRGEVRPHYSALLDALMREDLDVRRATLVEEMEAEGVVFAGPGGVRPFLVDPVPRVLGADEWTLLERGIAQRVRALNGFVADVYGERRIVRDGVVPARVVDEAEYHEPLLAGIEVRHDAWATVAGLDLVRGADGRFAVLEDNLRTPSGVAYALAARQKVARALAEERREGLDPRPIDPLAFELFGEALRDAAPEGVDEPFVVLLSDGPGNSAWWEHGVLAERLGLPIVTLADLERRGADLFARIEGTTKRVDVVYRRTDVDRLAIGDELTAVGGALLEPWREGRIGLANAFGTGVADDKLAHAYVEAMIDYYLGEAPVLTSVPTYDLGEPEVLQDVLERLEELVVKPRGGYGGVGVVVCPHATDQHVAEVREAVLAEPQRFVAQETVAISRHPTVVDGRLEPRHVDLRPFAYSGARVAVLPGGLTRVAFSAGAMVVNSSQDGGGKDTWVMP